MDTFTPAILLSTFCLVQLIGLGAVLIPNPVYKLVSTLSDVVILYIVLGSCVSVPEIVSFLFKVRISPCFTDSIILTDTLSVPRFPL